MVLSDRDLRRELRDGFLVIDPLEDWQIQPASIDLRLHDDFLTYGHYASSLWEPGPVDNGIIDLDNIKNDGKRFYSKCPIIKPGEFLLGSTLERVSLCDRLVARVEGKSSLGRLGLMVHITAGFIDSGFTGQITLELYNVNNRPIRLRAGKPICQLSVMALSSRCENPYGSEKLNSKYQNQTGTVGSKYGIN